MAKFFLYLFFIFVIILGLEFFKIVDVPYLEIPDFVSGTEEILQQNTQKADQVE